MVYAGCRLSGRANDKVEFFGAGVEQIGDP
jgi:hypothetical protein